jgi:hypothetical protein
LEFSDDLLSFSTKLVFSTDGLTYDLKVYWGRIITFFYSSKYSPQQIRKKEVEFAIKKFTSQEQWLKDFEALREEDKIVSVVLLRLLLNKAKVFDQPITADILSELIESLTGIIGGDNRLLIEEKYREHLAALLRHENRKKIIVPASIMPLALDYLFKWIILIACRLASASTGQINTFIICESFLFIGIFIYISYRDRIHNEKLFQKYKAVDDYKIDFQFSAQKYTWLAFFFISSVVINNFIDVKDEGGGIPDYVFSGLLISFYYLIALRFFQSGRLSEVSLVRQLRSQKDLNETHDSGKIDRAIVEVETAINSRTGRLDAYVLESALFGALAFGGFLQIIATDYVSFKELDQFSKLVFDLVQSLITLDVQTLQNSTTQLYTKNNLFCLAAIETLLCSGLFIAVIASRLRFSDVADRVKKAVEIAKAYQAKEESKQFFLFEIREQMTLAKSALEEIGPISGYMQYFRNAGLVMFLLVLISCSLFVTSFLGWLYVGVGIATWVYFNRELLNSKLRELALAVQLNFIRRPYLLLIISLLLILTGFLTRIIFAVEDTTFLIVTGFFGTALYLFFLVILVPNFDDRFGEIEKTSRSGYSGNWNTIHIVYGIFIFLCVASVSLFAYINSLYALGAFGLFALSIAFLDILIGYYCSKRKWLGILIGLLSFPVPIEIVSGLTPTMFFGMANQSLPLLGIALGCFLATIIWKKQFHLLFRNILAVSALLMVILALPTIYGKLNNNVVLSIPVTLTSWYQHKTIKLDSLTYWMTERLPMKRASNEDLNLLLKKSRGYRSHYQGTNGYTFVYDIFAFRLNMVSDTLFQKGKAKKDSIRLLKALELEQERKSIFRLFKFKYLGAEPELEADILIELKRKPEALRALKEIIDSEADDGVKKSVRKKLKEIEEGKSPRKSRS